MANEEKREMQAKNFINILFEVRKENSINVFKFDLVLATLRLCLSITEKEKVDFDNWDESELESPVTCNHTYSVYNVNLMRALLTLLNLRDRRNALHKMLYVID